VLQNCVFFFGLWCRDPVLELHFFTPLRVVLLCFASQYLAIALQWLHQGCDNTLSADFLSCGAGDFPFKIHFKKCFKNRLFFALAPRSGLGAAISGAIVRKCLCM